MFKYRIYMLLAINGLSNKCPVVRLPGDYNEGNRCNEDVNGLGYTEYMQKAIDYIEENLQGPITIEDCARVSGFSKFHFHRLFSIHLDVTLMEYIRRRRLCHAMNELIRGRRILDIAMDYGYSSERAFSRAFLQEFGQVPSRCRSANYSLPPKPLLEESLNHSTGGIPMDYLSEVRIDSLHTMNTASGVRISKDPEAEVITFMSEWSAKTGIGAGTRRFGFDVPVSEEQQQEGLRGYEYWVVLGQDIPALAEGITCKHVEGCRYAILRITEPFADPFERIPLGWKKLAAWVNSRGYQTACDKERYWLEEVQELGQSVVMDLYFPIE
ncbi:helix-turn-helix domain-containing protein [Paenibacillus sp. FSL H7-0357]|uniref:helix-turn-helix domain-containing protein n=2 Tax=Paenibacillus sp. FSL H7-0357 TaxID=1536774 RepID=UPI0009E016CE|nr:AraC family transcriptional regulator [Paenibacillus sp. FSL H7-0357]